jgi:hypothetical protein
MFIEKTKNWLEKIVIGLNLCPFAKHPFKSDKIRYVLHKGNDLNVLSETLVAELRLLAKADSVELETTLIIVPDSLFDFEDYLNYVDFSEQILEELELDGVIQVASFHPLYQFDGTKTDDVENYTNRSPYPMLHLLKESSVTWAVDNFPDVDEIPNKNIETMKNLGIEKVKEYWISDFSPNFLFLIPFFS